MAEVRASAFKLGEARTRARLAKNLKVPCSVVLKCAANCSAHVKIEGEAHMASELKELVEYLAKALVDLPDQVEVTEIAGEQTTVLELKVAKEDLGKVIGKQGRTARAVRTILNAASTKLRKRSVLEIIE